MGNLRDNGGNERPQEGDGLPDLPPEWGTVIIPDDAAELDHEGSALRRQFRRESFRRRWRSRLHLKPRPFHRIDEDSPGLAVPLLIMTVAVIATLTSLFAVAWPGQRPRTLPQAGRSPSAVSVADVGMVDDAGGHVPLRQVVPAVVLLVEGCSCETFIAATFDAVNAAKPATMGGPSATSTFLASAAPTTTPVSVLVIDTGVPKVPALTAPNVRVRGLADPTHALRNSVPALVTPVSGETLSPAALLIDRNGVVIKTLPHVGSVDEFRTDLARLW